MIISHQYRYLFVELPRTGSTAISRELRENYAGERILRKHSTYYEFLKKATPEEKTYFTFSCIRNPLDDAVSRYFKLRSDHRRRYTDPDKLKKRWTVVERMETWLYHYIQKTGDDFPSFFLKFYLLPYDNWASMTHRQFDCVLRFEHLREDFDQVLRLIGIEPVRPLPVVNKTGARARDYLAYYTPRTIPRARRIFGPFMRQWGYQFPPEWGETAVPGWHQFQYEFIARFRHLYWRHLRYRI